MYMDSLNNEDSILVFTEATGIIFIELIVVWPGGAGFIYERLALSKIYSYYYCGYGVPTSERGKKKKQRSPQASTWALGVGDWGVWEFDCQAPTPFLIFFLRITEESRYRDD